MPTIHWLQGVEWVAILWVICLGIGLVTTVQIVRNVHWSELRRLLSDENGVAYTLSYVLTVPIYILVINLIVQATLILMVKMGTVYSAYAAARSAIVWSTTNPSLMQDRAHLAAVHALVPFADSHRARDTSSNVGCEEFLEAYRKYADKSNVKEDYLRAKYNFARKNLHLQPLTIDSSRSDGDVTATVVYDMPLRIAVVNRILGTNGPGGLVCHIESKITLPNEGAKTEGPEWRLKGVRYDPS